MTAAERFVTEHPYIVVGAVLLSIVTGLFLAVAVFALGWAVITRPQEVIVERERAEREPRRGRRTVEEVEEVEVEFEDEGGRRILATPRAITALEGMVPVEVQRCPKHPEEVISKFRDGRTHLGCENCESGGE